MRADHYSQGPMLPPSAEPGLRVVDDFPTDIPVVAAELDVIEAFLGAQLRAILNDAPEDGVREQAAPNTDLNLCHNHAKLKPRRKSRE